MCIMYVYWNYIKITASAESLLPVLLSLLFKSSSRLSRFDCGGGFCCGVLLGDGVTRETLGGDGGVTTETVMDERLTLSLLISALG